MTYFDIFKTYSTQTISINTLYSVQQMPGSASFEQLLWNLPKIHKIINPQKAAIFPSHMINFLTLK